MSINITGRGIDVTQGMRDYVDKRFSLLTRRGASISGVSIILESNEHRTIHTASATILLPGKKPIHANAPSEDMYKSIDTLAAKLERQISKQHGKDINHHRCRDPHCTE